jgi:hypothetical protein
MRIKAEVEVPKGRYCYFEKPIRCNLLEVEYDYCFLFGKTIKKYRKCEDCLKAEVVKERK